MTLLLRKQRAQDRIDGREPLEWSDDDYAVVDDTVIGRIYKEMIHGKGKWQVSAIYRARPGSPVPPPSQGWPLYWRRRRQRSPSVMVTSGAESEGSSACAGDSSNAPPGMKSKSYASFPKAPEVGNP
jgi:hypothetical protein